MLKSITMKRDIDALKDEIKAFIEKKEAVPAEKQKELEDKLTAYSEQKALEAEAKKKSYLKGENKMDKKRFNAALKNFLLGRAVTDTEYATYFEDKVAGQNGAVAADGGVLVPEELLSLRENNGVGVDLRAITTAIPVTTRAGTVPCIDYGQDVELTDFEENTEIVQKKGVFTSVKYTLASKGAIIPVSRELLLDANSDVLAIIGKLFNRVYGTTVNKDICAKVLAAAKETNIAAMNTVVTVDAVKKAIIELPLDAGSGATVVMNQATWAGLALAKDKQDRYLLSRDANNAAVKEIEGRPIIVVEGSNLADNTILVGDFSALYHIAYPSLEVASSEEAGFTKNSVLVRAVCRFTDISVYDKAFVKLTKTP